MTIAWVIGGNGLLGSALQRSLQRSGTNLFTPVEQFRWKSESELIVQLETAVKDFTALVSSENGWQIYWAAGVGTMGSEGTALTIETQILSTLLSFIESEQGLIAAEGCFVFASSAGAIYAGVTKDIITEKTPAAPTTAYAREKLKQESLISAFANNNCKVSALLARISTLYGPGQANGKQQGIFSEIARRILRNQPIQIYVPFDTIRDYITADDAANTIIACTRAIREKQGVFTKIIASELPTTIAEIISIYKRIARRTPRIVISTSNLSSLYNRRIQFHSINAPAIEKRYRTSLFVGIAQVMAAERSALTRSR
ncbi:NAD(P)-dependent oxidoreductase [Methylicorpusculum sp.]|uniref:NAD-dependent epimerase/dehydratase family protein n=1 Tax=Methylicorpusculum sp. TaxID=2713644 RepID=UPI0027239DC7|nr:NAD-dependent epimerase/dehydratase family protein [Methylicorpusculum sp.]MDO8843253.1 NAD-dependent epimerase/dehydratase family protein [Methylicorpusculum sp.]